MRDRWFGAIVGLLCVILTIGFARTPWGWVAAAVLFGLIGWMVGGYIRRLRRLSERDALTGISNRRFFERALKHCWRESAAGGGALSLIFVDVDDFGALNKCHGHLMGDEALKLIARLIRQNIRSTDLVARWGGEEFVVLLPGTDIDQAARIAERIRTVIQQSPIRDRELEANMTISLGVAGYPGTASSPSDLLHQAVQGQQRAKVHKNAVEVVL